MKMIKEFFRKYIFTWDFLLSYATSFSAIIFGIIGLIHISTIEISTSKDAQSLTLVDFKPLKDFVLMIVFMAVSFIILIARSSYNTDKKNEKTRTEIDTLKRIVQQKCIRGQVTADQFFINRADLEDIETVLLPSEPKTLKYSGGPLLFILTHEKFKHYLRDADVKVQFIFPDPNIDYVIKDFVDNITVGEKIDNWKNDILKAEEMLRRIIDDKPKAKIEYKFCQFAPSFGLQIIESDNNERLYVDLYTIGIPKDKRYQFKIEKQNSPDTYNVFNDQFEKLWKKSSKRKKVSKYQKNKTNNIFQRIISWFVN